MILGVGLVGLLVLFLWLTLRSMAKPKSHFSIYFRLLVSHGQMLMLLASFRFDWPQQVKAFLSFFESVTDAPRELFSLDCLLSHIPPLPGVYNFFLI